MSQSRKNRPINGPGANHLRGGVGIYSTKTAVGSWMDNVGGSSGYTRGFTTNEFLTEAQIAQMQGKRVLKYGAALPPPSIALNDVTPTEFALSVVDTGPDHFKSTTQIDFESINRPPRKDVYSPKKKSSGGSVEEVASYRASWTNDTVEGRSQRFETESRRAANYAVKDDFKVNTLRATPGTPQGFERILEAITEKYGILGVTALRKELGAGEKDSTKLRVALMNSGSKLSREHFGQVVAFLTRGETFQAERFFNILCASSSNFNSAGVRSTFQKYFGNSGVASVQEVAELYPELENALLHFLDVYSSNNGISPDDFVLLHTDMFTSMPSKYKTVIEKA